MKKRVLSMFMALALCLTLLPTAAFAEGEDVSISGGVIGGGETGGEGGGVLVPPGGSTGEGGGIYVAPGSPTEGGGGTYIPGEDTQTEIWCTSKPDSIGRGYDGTTDGSTIPINLTFTDGTNNIILKEGTGFTAKKTFDSADAGWHTVTVEIALIGEAAVKYKLRAGEEKFEINGNINKAYPKLTVSLSQTTCTVGEKLLPLLSVSGVQENAAVTYFYTPIKAGYLEFENSDAVPKIDENTAISDPGTYYVYAKSGGTKNYEEERSTTAELTVNKAVVEAASVTKADGTDGGTYKTLPAALNAAQDGDTVKLLANHTTNWGDVEAGEYATLAVVKKTLTLDLNGMTVDYLTVGEVVPDEEGGILDSTNGNLTITDNGQGGAPGTINDLNFVKGTLEIQSGQIGNSDGSHLTCNGDSGSVTIRGGTVLDLTVGEGASVTVSGGSEHAGNWHNDGTLNITGGTFGNVNFCNNGGTIAISGGTFGTITNTGASGSIPLMPLLADPCAFYQGDKVQDSTAKTLTNVTVRPHTHSFENGKCACGVAAIVVDNHNSCYNTLQAALNAAAKDASITSVTLGQDLTEDITFSGSAAGSLTLNMNGHKLETEAGVPLTVTGGTLRIEGAGEINQNTASNATAFPAISLTGGKLVIAGNLTAQGGYDSSSGRKPAIYATDGELDLQGNVSLNGGLTITGTAKLTNLLTKGTFYVDASETGNAIAITDSEVPGGEVYKKALELLAKDYAFYRANGSLADAGGAKLRTGTYTIKSHTCSYTHNETYGIAYCNCGRSHAHRDLSDEKSVLVNGVCPICGYHCPHKNIGDDGVCTDCNAKMVAKVTVGETTTYTADLADALNKAANGTTVTLLADIKWGVTPKDRAAITGDGKIVTLNLNRHTITGGWFDIGSNDNPTSCTLKIIGEGSHESLGGSGGCSGVFPEATLDLSEWKGGTINAINISDNSKYDETTREAAVIVGPKAGTIGKLTFGNNQLDELKKTKLSGGSFNEIWAANHKPVKLGELLADGYAFQNGDGSYVKYETTLRGASIYNVKVVKCLHPNMKPDETGVATCEYCGKSGKFVASVDGNLYTNMDEAVTDWLANGGTLKLYADYTATDGTWRIGSGLHTINLNGHRMSVQGDGAFKPTNNMHLTVTDGKKIGQITNILLDGNQGGSFTLESGYVCNMEMTDGAVVALKGGSVDNLDVQNCSASTNLSIQGGSIGKLNIKDWADGMHVSATGGSLGAYTLPSGKILADVLDHQYYAEGTSLDRQVDTAQPVEKFVIKQAPYDFGSTSKAADVPINGSIPFMVDSPSENVGVYDVKWYRRTNSGAEHMTENKVAGVNVNVNDTLDVFCVITGLDRPGGAMQWQVAVKDYTINVVPAKLNGDQTVITQKPNTGNTGNPADNRLVVTPVTSYMLSGVEYKFEVTYNGQPLELDKDYTIKDSSNKAMNAGTHTLTIEGKGNYTGEKSVTWTLEPYELSVENFRHAHINKTYDGTDAVTDSTNGISGLNSFMLDSKNPRNPILSTVNVFYLGKSDYQLSNMKFDSAEAGDRTFTGTMTLTSGGNFVFASGSRVMPIEYGSVSGKQCVWINSAIIAAPAAKALQVANNHAATYTVDLSALLPALEAPREYGAVTYGAPTVNLSSDYYTSGARVEDGKLILPIQAVNTETTGSIGSVQVKVSTTNYHDFTLTINVNAANKIVPTGAPTRSKTTLAWGEQLSTITLSGAMKDGDTEVKGTFAWTNSATTPSDMNDFEAEWKFTPENTDVYAEITDTVTIKVIKATPTGAPKYTAINASGKTLADAALAVNEAWPEGTVQWVDENGVELNVSAEVKANTAYRWRFVPTDAEHYNEASGAITLYTVSHSGGGGSSSGSSDNNPIIKTETKNNADGSTTKAETKKDGTVIETTTGKDGFVSKTETKPDGSSVTENKAADGSTGTVKTDKNGQTTAETALSSKAIEDAKKSGEAVKAPVEVEATRNSDTAPTVKIELPRNSGETKVEIPVSNVKPGTVAVLVHADGTEEIVKNSLPTEDGIQLTVNGGATVKIVDNSKDFIDTRSHWAKDAIDFVSARGLVNGMNDSIYAPNNSTTRAQLWTILARQNDADLNGGNTWYEKAQLWSKNKGISDGTEPNAAINRAQMVTMLWRTMGQPTAGGTANFTDVPADSYYASAVAWAVENDITDGVGDGRFDPAATCTRAQIATFLWRAMAE